MKASANNRRLAALAAYVRLRDPKAAVDARALLEILACASLRYQARTAKPLLHIPLHLGGDGLHSPELAEVLASASHIGGPDLSLFDAEALQALEEVLAASPEERREPVAAMPSMTNDEVADTEAWLTSLQRRRNKPVAAAAQL